MQQETNYYMRYSEDMAISGVSNLALVWRH